MNLTCLVSEGKAAVQVHAARIDAAVSIRFKDLFGEATEGGPDDVLLDLAEVEFIDSSGLGALVAARKMLGPYRTLALSALHPSVEKVLRLTHMDRVFPIYPDAASFLAGPGEPQSA
ncbi:STAS domain-containing protein [Roseicyclus sp.]|uniref:STAS domain-containing protein n=1 Tax=Roseicyclus sp. TaxID=1914329 RepID=UPI003F9F5438